MYDVTGFDRSGRMYAVHHDSEEIRPTKTGKVYSTPGMNNDDVTASRYSPAFTQQRHDVMQVRQPRDEQVRPSYTGPQPRQSAQPRRSGKTEEESPAFNDDIVPRRSAKQMSSLNDMTDGRTRPYQNGYGVGQEEVTVRTGYGITETRPPVNGEHRLLTEEEVRYRNLYSERADTPQSGRLSQAAMIVREKFEDDGEFDQVVAIDRRGLDGIVLFR